MGRLRSKQTGRDTVRISNTSQNANILSHLQAGKTISPIEALIDFRCFRLAARINELRNAGHNIVTHKDNDYAVYSLGK